MPVPTSSWIDLAQHAGTNDFRRLAEAMRGNVLRQTQCPYCLTTEEMVLESGLLGCPICYIALPEAAFRVK